MAKIFSGTTDAIGIPFSFQCEKCGKLHSRTCLKGGTSEVGISPESVQRKSLNRVRYEISKLKKAAAEGDYSWIDTDPCPDCGYTQSWQLEARKSETQTIILGLVLLIVLDLACITANILGSANSLAWIIAALLLIGTGLLARSIIMRRRRIGQESRTKQVSQPQVEWPIL